jgi:D-alanyl-D-alanine carboxypeptidase (penicillin-binding protein 5/6)
MPMPIARSEQVRRFGGGMNGAGIVLLAMLVLATLIGVGSRAINAYDEANDPSDPPEGALVVAGDNTGDMAQAAPDQEPGVDAEAPIGGAESEQSAEEPKPVYAAPAGVTATAIHGYDPATGQLLFWQEARAPMPVGSIVKVATALVTVEHAALDETVLIDSTDLVDFTVYSNMALVPGDTLTVEQLLQGLLVTSGGDAAEALSRYVGGKLSGSDDPETARAAFIDEMNAYAARIGLLNTHFVTAAGDDAEGSYSTAEDVSLLAGRLMANPVLAEIVGQFEYTFTGANGVNTYTGYNTNALLGVSGVIGVKTGSTGDAGGCVVLARQMADDELIILTILGSDLAYNDLNQIIADARWDDAELLFGQIPS